MKRLWSLTLLAMVVCFFLAASCGDDDDDNDDAAADDDDASVDDDDATDDDDAADDDDDAADDDDDDDAPGEIDWEIEQVDSVGAGSRQTDIELDEDGAVHLVYTGCVNNNCDASALTYGVKQAKDGQWTTNTVDSATGDTGWFPALSMGEMGALYVTYAKHSDSGDNRLRFAFKGSGVDWTTSDIGSGDGGFWTSNVFADGVFTMAHTKLASGMVGSLQVGIYDGSWDFQVLDDEGDCGWFTSMALTPENMPVVAHIEGYPVGFLKILTYNGASWDPIQIESGAYAADIAVDPEGFYHLAYPKDDSVNEGVWDLWYATNAPDGDWQKTMIDGGATEEEDTGGFPSIAIDPNGNLHVTYRNFSQDALMYARNVGASWEFATADSIGGGLYSSLAADADGGVHVVYENGNDLFYGRCDTCGVME